MGHCIWGYTVPGTDCVSATANCDGFTPLTSLMREYPWDCTSIAAASKLCNQTDTPIFLGSLWPRLILVPRTKGRTNPTLAGAYAEFLTAGNVRHVHFSHYGFVQGRLPISEFDETLSAVEMAHGVAGDITLTVDMDSRRVTNANALLGRRRG